MDTTAQVEIENESDRVMREQAMQLKGKKKQPKVTKEQSGVFDSADCEMNKFKQKGS